MDLTVDKSHNIVLLSYYLFILQEKTKYLFSFNFVALNFVLPELQQVCQLSTFYGTWQVWKGRREWLCIELL